MERAKAWELLRAYNKDHFHLQHALTVEAVMRWFANDLGYGAEADYWGTISILSCTPSSTASNVWSCCKKAACRRI